MGWLGELSPPSRPPFRSVLALGTAAILLSGCLPTHSIGSLASKRNCLADNARFSEAWVCVRARLVAGEQSDVEAKRDGLIEEGDLLAQQVRSGKVSDADAKRRLSAGLAHEVGQ